MNSGLGRPEGGGGGGTQTLMFHEKTHIFECVLPISLMQKWEVNTDF